jgi:hypothetical protein
MPYIPSSGKNMEDYFLNRALIFRVFGVKSLFHFQGTLYNFLCWKNYSCENVVIKFSFSLHNHCSNLSGSPITGPITRIWVRLHYFA